MHLHSLLQCMSPKKDQLLALASGMIACGSQYRIQVMPQAVPSGLI
jgi:hypothetical protein